MLEACAALVLLTLILGTLGGFTSAVSRSWQSAATDPFAETEAAFETVTQSLGRATLEPYRDYVNADGAFRAVGDATFVPDHLALRSDLAFVCGNSATLLATSGRTTGTGSVFFVEPGGDTEVYAQDGLDRLLNARGYFVEFGGDIAGPGFFTGPGRLRWRLKQVMQPSESLQIFTSTASAPWIAQLAGGSATPAILAENVIALAVLPERAASDPGAALAPAFAYDSRDATNALTLAQLPPRVRVVLAAIDEASAQRLAAASGTAPPALVPSGVFQSATKLDDDVASLDASLTAARVGHRIFQRDVALAAACWSNQP